MATKKIIAVIGSTGAQGGGLARAILADKNGEFTLRAVTRKPDSERARALASAGAEVVHADMDDRDSLRRAFEGAHGAYCLTSYWEHFSPEKELEQAEHTVAALKQAGIKHAIWSTLEDTRKFYPLSDNRMPTIDGKWKVPHFDAKGEADALYRNSGVPTTYLLASFYWENFIFFGAGPKPGPDGKLVLTLPIGNAKMAGIGAEDIGRCAYGIFKKGPAAAGKHVGIAGEHLTGNEMATKLSRALGREVAFNAIPADAYRGFGFPGAIELGNMYQFYDQYEKECNSTRDVGASRALDPALQNFDAWLAANATRIPLE